MFFQYFIPVFIAVMFVLAFLSIFTKKGRSMSTKGFFWGGEVVKDYGWLDNTGTVNPLTTQRIQVMKYKKNDETFFVLMVKDTTVTSVQMMPVKLSEQEAHKLISILSEKN